MRYIGGLNAKSVEWYDPIVDVWTQGVPMTNVHYGAASITLNGSIMVCGGHYNSDLSGM